MEASLERKSFHCISWCLQASPDQKDEIYQRQCISRNTVGDAFVMLRITPHKDDLDEKGNQSISRYKDDS